MDDCWNRHDGWSGTLYIGYWYIFLGRLFSICVAFENPYFQMKQSYAYRIKFNKITLKKGDKLLRVHIPRTGARLERDE